MTATMIENTEDEWMMMDLDDNGTKTSKDEVFYQRLYWVEHKPTTTTNCKNLAHFQNPAHEIITTTHKFLSFPIFLGCVI